jgi:hypothetical protein
MTPPPGWAAIGRCLRDMNSDNTGMMLASVLALKRALFVRGKTLDDLADWIKGWALYEIALQDAVPEHAEALFGEAMDAEAEAAAASEVKPAIEEAADGNIHP